MTRKFVKRSIFFFLSFIISVDITSIISRLLILLKLVFQACRKNAIGNAYLRFTIKTRNSRVCGKLDPETNSQLTCKILNFTCRHFSHIQKSLIGRIHAVNAPPVCAPNLVRPSEVGLKVVGTCRL